MTQPPKIPRDKTNDFTDKMIGERQAFVTAQTGTAIISNNMAWRGYAICE